MSEAPLQFGLDLRREQTSTLDLDQLARQYAAVILDQLERHAQIRWAEDPKKPSERQQHIDWKHFAGLLYIRYASKEEMAVQYSKAPNASVSEFVPKLSGEIDPWIARAIYMLAFRVPDARILTRYDIVTKRQGRERDDDKRLEWLRLIEAEFRTAPSLVAACKAAIAKNTKRRDSKSAPSVATLTRYWRERVDVPSSSDEEELRKQRQARKQRRDLELARSLHATWTPIVEEIARRAALVVQHQGA